MRTLVVVLSLAALPALAGSSADSPLHFELPSPRWQPRGDLALAMGDNMVDRRGPSGALVYREETLNSTLQGAYGTRELGSDSPKGAKTAYLDTVGKTALGGWVVDRREHKVVGGSEVVRVEAHDDKGVRSITWSAAAIDGKSILSGVLQCVYPATPSAESACRSIIASAKLGRAKK